MQPSRLKPGQTRHITTEEAIARQDGQLVCRDCGQPYFYPRPNCPECGSADVEWFAASGQATLYSYVINHRPARGFENEGPYAIAVVQLAEGPRMMTNITGIPNTPSDLILDMELQVTFEQRVDVSIPLFAPAGAAQ